jgi:hypothetical protein
MNGTSDTSVGQRHPLDETRRQEILQQFYLDGAALVPGVLAPQECAALRQKTDEIFDDMEKREASHHGISFVISNPLLHDRAFADLFMREPILSLVEEILGPECRFCGQSVIRNQPGEAVTLWHVDDCNKLDFPLPEDVPRHDARVRMPVFWLSVQIPLTDIDSMEDGPTQIVPGSHYSGRLPNSQEHPEFEGRGPEPIFCKAGDIYLFNHQVWHQGSPNRSERTRYLLQLQYACGGTRAFRFQGLSPSPEVDRVLSGADERMLRVLGRTAPTYGI